STTTYRTSLPMNGFICVDAQPIAAMATTTRTAELRRDTIAQLTLASVDSQTVFGRSRAFSITFERRCDRSYRKSVPRNDDWDWNATARAFTECQCESRALARTVVNGLEGHFRRAATKKRPDYAEPFPLRPRPKLHACANL